jgi:hypothetical protein
VNIRLRKIQKPALDTRVILEPKWKEVLPVIRGNGDLNLLCGNCGAILAQGIFGGRIRDIVIHCPVCDSYNNLP